jgi:F0F1-type ATP synthase membrane subunit a
VKKAVIAVLILALVAVGFLFARGPQPHIVVPPEKLWTVGPLNITSTLMAAWGAMVIIISVAWLCTRNISLIPGRGQSLMEGLVGFLMDQAEQIAGEHKARVFFPIIATFFIFILIANWFALLPWVKAVGNTTDYGVEIFHYISEYSEKEDGFSKKEFLAWDVEKSGPFGLVNIGSTDAFKFNIEEGTDAQVVFDYYVIALAKKYTDFETDFETEKVRATVAPDEALVRDAYEALLAGDPNKVPRFLTAEDMHIEEDDHGEEGGESEHHGVHSDTLDETFYGVDFPGTKLVSIYPWFRPAFSDVNNTLALAICAFFVIEFWGFKFLGLGYLGKFFIAPWKNPIMFIVGLLELLSEFIRIISFAFRLFGNIFAGSVLILIFTFLLPFFVPLTIYGLELFVGFIQAAVFSLLVLVFGSMATEGHGEHDEEHGPGDGHGATPHHEGAVQAH